MVQGIFDDLNPETRRPVGLPRHRPVGPRAQHPRVPRRHAGVAASTACSAFTINLQGGSPQGYSQGPALAQLGVRRPTAALRPDYLARLARILDQADELGMVVILGVFYFGQDERLKDEAAVKRGVGQRRRLAARQGLPQRADRDQQRVQRPVRPRDPQAGPRPRADRAGARRGRGRPAAAWSARATAAARVPTRERRRARPTSCCCTATA